MFNNLNINVNTRIPRPLSYPAAVVLHQVQLDGLHAAIVTARVDLKHKTMI